MDAPALGRGAAERADAGRWRDASICGLGQAAMNPVQSVLKHFREDVGDDATLAMTDHDPLHARRRARSRPQPGETIWQVAQPRSGIEIPHLC